MTISGPILQRKEVNHPKVYAIIIEEVSKIYISSNLVVILGSGSLTGGGAIVLTNNKPVYVVSLFKFENW